MPQKWSRGCSHARSFCIDRILSTERNHGSEKSVLKGRKRERERRKRKKKESRKRRKRRKKEEKERRLKKRRKEEKEKERRVLSDCPAFLGQAQEGEPRCPTAELRDKHGGLGRDPSSTSSQLSKTCGLAMPRLGPAGHFSPSSSKAEANRKRSGEPGSAGRQGRGLPAGPQPGAAPHLPRHGGDARHHPVGSPPASRSGTERLWLAAATCEKAASRQSGAG